VQWARRWSRSGTRPGRKPLNSAIVAHAPTSRAIGAVYAGTLTTISADGRDKTDRLGAPGAAWGDLQRMATACVKRRRERPRSDTRRDVTH
jgi:hypothetical protein